MDIEKIDIAAAARQEALALVLKDYAMLKDTIEAIEVSNDDELKVAGDFRLKVDKFNKAIETKRKEYVDDYNKLVKKINGEFKPIAALFDALQVKLDAKIIPYQKELIRRKEEWVKAQREKELAEMAAKSKTIEAVAYETESTELMDMASDIDAERERIAAQDIKIKKTTTGDEARTTLKKTWHVRVINPSIVSREFCIPDERLLKDTLLGDKKEAAIKGEYVIPGVEVYYTESIVSTKAI